MTNCNPETGIRYGVISFNSLADWCSDDLFYGSGARDLSYEEAFQELTDQKTQEVQWEVDEGKHSLADEPDFDFEGEVQSRIERGAEHIEIDEPIIEGECDGVKYHISWLGGAPLLWVIEGPLGFAERLCSPCVPNAADLDGGFELTSLSADQIHRDHDGYLCYVLPRDWLRSED